MKKLRLSYTFLLLWSQGRHDDALAMYFHKDIPKSKAMTEGIELHREWAAQIMGRKLLTLGGTTLTFVAPQCEVRHVVAYNEQFDLSGHLDCIDGETLYEFKSGVTDSGDYASGYQLPLYFLIAKLADFKIEKGILVHFNQHTGKSDITLVWNNDRQIERARNFIDSLGGEIYEYFIQHKLPFNK